MKAMRKALLYIAIILSCAAIYLFVKLNALFLFALLVGLLIVYIKKHAGRTDVKFLIAVIACMAITRFFLANLVMEARGGRLTQDEGLYSTKAVVKTYESAGIPDFEKKIAGFFDDDGDILNKDYGYNVYTYLLTGFYYIFGYQIQAARFINVFLNIMVFLFMFYTAKELFGPKVAKVSSAVFAFFPSTTLWSVSIGIDTLALLCVSAYLFSLISAITKFSLKWVAAMAVLYFMLDPFRGFAASALLFVTIFGFLWVLFERMTKRARILAGLVCILLALCFILTPLASIAADKLNKGIHVIINRQSAFATVDDGGYLTFPAHCYRDFTCGFTDLSAAYTKGMTYVLFSPFPWDIGSKLQLMAYPQVILWYCMLPFIAYGFYLGYKKSRLPALVMFLYCFLVFSTLALAEGNVGSLFRHKDMAVPFTLIYFAAGILAFTERPTK